MLKDDNAVAKSKGKVLFIDDSPTALQAVSEWLTSAGYEVIALARSFGASRVVMRERPHVVLLDIRMPGLSGDRLAKLFAQNPVTASVPVIFHSEIDPDQLARLALECSVVGAISKGGSRIGFLRDFERLALPFLPHAAHPESVRHSSRHHVNVVPEPPSVGIPELDEQHLRIRQLLNRIAALHQHDPHEIEAKVVLRREFKEALSELLVFMRFHLATEDRYMREWGHSKIEEHRIEHTEMLREMAPIQAQIDSANVSDLMTASKHLSTLVLEHMLGSDLEFSAAE